MILVTGAAGFIGSSIVQALSNDGHTIVAVDSLGHGRKWQNLNGAKIHRWFQPHELERALEHKPWAVVHMGAISSTTEMDGDQVISNNFETSVRLWDWCQHNQAQFIYASSASTYGDGSQGFEDRHDEIPNLLPLNLYGWSKQLFDLRCVDLINRRLPSPPQWAGLKFFNVYGPREQHKGSQSSVIFQQWLRIQQGQEPRLFKSTHLSIPDGEQKRDFVWIGDCVNVVVWLLNNPQASGIFNVGSGVARSFNDVISCLQSPLPTKYVDMPAELVSHYQNYTCANIAKLRAAGYNIPMTGLEQGVEEYRKWLNHNPH